VPDTSYDVTCYSESENGVPFKSDGLLVLQKKTLASPLVIRGMQRNETALVTIIESITNQYSCVGHMKGDIITGTLINNILFLPSNVTEVSCIATYGNETVTIFKKYSPRNEVNEIFIRNTSNNYYFYIFFFFLSVIFGCSDFIKLLYIVFFKLKA
jgi:hypothetical protein